MVFKLVFQILTFPTQVSSPNPAAVETVRTVIKQQRDHWSCLAAAACLDLPDIQGPEPEETAKKRKKNKG